MSAKTKTQEIADLNAELTQRDLTITRLEDEKGELIARAIQRNSDYEAEIRDLKNAIDKIATEAIDLTGRLTTKISEARSQAQFLAQGLVSIAAYGGGDIAVLQDLAGVLVRDWLPSENDED